MKTKILKISACLTLCFSAQATEMNWVKTPFWSAPQVTDFNLKLAEASLEVKENCKRYSKLIFSEDGSMNWPNQPLRIDRFRKTVMAGSPMDVDNFEAFFQIESPLERGSYSEVEVNHPLEIVTHRSESLPNYLQSKAYSGAFIAEISEIEIKIEPETKSLTKVSRSLNLEDSQVMMTRNRQGLLGIKIYGRDVACDLLEGNIKLTAKAPGYVGLEKEQASNLSDFYHGKLEDDLNQILSNKEESLTFKAARLGFRWGKLLEEEFKESDEKSMEGSLKTLFDLAFIPKTLNPNLNIVEINKRKTFRFSSTVEGKDALVNFSF